MCPKIDKAYNWVAKIILYFAVNHNLSNTPILGQGNKSFMKKYVDIRFKGFPGGSDGNESACNAGDRGSTPRSGGCPEEGNGNPLQYSCLKNSMDRGAWQLQAMGSQRVGHD